MVRYLMVAMALPFVLVQFVVAQSKPSTLPAEQEAPKAALRALAVAMEGGDAEGIRGNLSFKGEQETRMVEAIVEYATALASLRQVALKTYGPEGAKAIIGDVAEVSAATTKRIDQATVRQEGDVAVVQPPQGQAMQLAKIDGKWKLPIGQAVRSTEAGVLEENIATISAQARIVKECTGDMSAGKFRSSDEAWASMMSRMMRAATQPTTVPATQGSP
jgi:hypothetical protein